MAGAGAGAYFAGVYMSAVGKYQEGKTQKHAHEYNAQRAEERAQYEETQSRLKWKRLIGQQAALYAKAGVDIASGSPLLIMSQTAAEGELEALNIRYAGENEAALQRWYGKRAMKAAKLAAWSTLLTGGGGYAASQYGGRSSGGSSSDDQQLTANQSDYEYRGSYQYGR